MKSKKIFIGEFIGSCFLVMIVVGWTIAGFISKDKAILTNFGLQIPLFIIGFYQILVP